MYVSQGLIILDSKATHHSLVILYRWFPEYSISPSNLSVHFPSKCYLEKTSGKQRLKESQSRTRYYLDRMCTDNIKVDANQLLDHGIQSSWYSFKGSRYLQCVVRSSFSFLSFLEKCFIYLFLEWGERREKEREKNINQLPLRCNLTRDRTHNPGTHTDQNQTGNLLLFGRKEAQSTEPHQSGLIIFFFKIIFPQPYDNR